MKTLFQQASGKCIPMLLASEVVHCEYARKHGYRYVLKIDENPHYAPFSKNSQGQLAFFSAACRFEDGEYFVYLDADVLIVKNTIDLCDALKDEPVFKGENDLAIYGAPRSVNGGVMVCKMTGKLASLFTYIVKKGPSENNDVMDSAIASYFQKHAKWAIHRGLEVGIPSTCPECYGDIGKVCLRCMSHGVVFDMESIKVRFLDDRWNYFDSYSGVKREVKCKPEDAIVRSWHGQPADAVVSEMTRELTMQE